MGNMNGENRKQVETEERIFESAEAIPAQEVQENVKTYITHNKGGKWELIKAPEVSMRGKKTACYIEDGCSLHLEIYSHMGELAPVYSTEKAVGLVLGTGNMGPRLTDNDSQKSLYLSRDGGLTWRSIRPGVHIYEIGDHGALIVIAQKNTPTTEIHFSWDEGESWDSLTISEHPIFVENIIIEPNSISQQFMVYGTYAEVFDEDDTEDFENLEMEKGNKAFLVYTDFSQLHEPQCKGVDTAGADESDYELWTPHDGRFGDAHCFLGQHKTFVRRKQASKCFNGEEHETVTKVEPCTCNEMDFECDIGYARNDGQGPCLIKEGKGKKQTEDEKTRCNRRCGLRSAVNMDTMKSHQAIVRSQETCAKVALTSTPTGTSAALEDISRHSSHSADSSCSQFLAHFATTDGPSLRRSSYSYPSP